VITAEETGTKPQERDVVSTALEKNGEILLGSSGRNILKEGAVWHVSPIQELLKPGASKQACNSRRTSVYSSLLSNARNRRKSSHALLIATQHKGKHISAAISCHATIAAA
jgi:hypothetical protein